MTPEHPNSPESWDAKALDETTAHGAAGCSFTGQSVRHEVVDALLEIEDGDSVFDFGCGTGEFCKRLPLHMVTYVGYDWSPAMRDRARREHGDMFVDEVPTEAFDHVVAIGPFNLADNWSNERTHETLDELWAITNKSLIVSLFAGPSGELTYDLDDAKRITQLSSRFTITTDYLPNDMTIKLCKPGWDSERAHTAAFVEGRSATRHQLSEQDAQRLYARRRSAFGAPPRPR